MCNQTFGMREVGRIELTYNSKLLLFTYTSHLNSFRLTKNIKMIYRCLSSSYQLEKYRIFLFLNPKQLNCINKKPNL